MLIEQMQEKSRLEVTYSTAGFGYCRRLNFLDVPQ